MLEKKLEALCGKPLKDSSKEELYLALMALVKEEAKKRERSVTRCV